MHCKPHAFYYRNNNIIITIKVFIMKSKPHAHRHLLPDDEMRVCVCVCVCVMWMTGACCLSRAKAWTLVFFSSSFRCFSFLSHRKGEIKEGLWNTGSPVITYSLPLCLSVPLFSYFSFSIHYHPFTSFLLLVILCFPTFTVPLSLFPSLSLFTFFSLRLSVSLLFSEAHWCRSRGFLTEREDETSGD